MKKSNSEWDDRTFNPITGCLHDCEYCYARKQANRFKSKQVLEKDGSKMIFGRVLEDCGNEYKETDLYIFDEKPYKRDKKEKLVVNSFPLGFNPTFHRYRLKDPQKIKTPQTIFVGSMADIFREWVPDEWIADVFKACEAAPWHRYLFLTKNLYRYKDLAEKKILPLIDGDVWGNPQANNFWFGVTETGLRDNEIRKSRSNPAGGINLFLNLEPLQADVTSFNDYGAWDWVIIGAETGSRKDKIIPKREWVEDIVNTCKEAGVPVFIRNNLAAIWGEPLIQEFPWKNSVMSYDWDGEDI